MLKFMNEEHKNNFIELLKRDKTFKGDCYRVPFFYLLSTDLTFNSIDKIYDFKEGLIKDVGVADKECFSSSARRLIRLAINLFANHRYEDQESVMDIFSVLDDERHMIALHSIDMRMRYYAYEKSVVEDFYNENNLTHEHVN